MILLRPNLRYRMIRSIYARGVTGNLSEPWNQGTLFQNSAGTTQVTAVEQGIGLELDTSLGMALGPNLPTNSTFNTDISGWIVGNVGESTLSWQSPGQIRIVRVNVGATYPNARTTVSGLTVGYLYKITSTCVTNPNSLEAYHGISGIAASKTSTPSTGTITSYFVATATSHNLDVGIWNTSGSPGQYVEFDNCFLQIISGNHLIQATGAAEPVWKQDANGKYYKKFDGIDDNFTCATGGGSSTAFSLQMAVMLEGAAAAQTLFSDAGTNIGLKIERDASNQIVLSGGNGGTFVPATSAAQTVGAAAVLTCKYNGTLLYIRINRGTPVTAAVTLSAGTAGFTVGKANGAASSYFNGRMYGRAYFKNYLLTDAEENAGIEFLAAKAGISL